MKEVAIMRWKTMILIAVFAALLPDLPLLTQRLFGDASEIPNYLAWATFVISFVIGAIFFAGPAGRWLSSAAVATALIGLISSGLALLAFHVTHDAGWYNIFRGFPAHLLQAATAVFLALYVIDYMTSGKSANC